MTLSTYQFSFTPNNNQSSPFVFGAGTPYIVEDVQGLMATSPLRNQDDNRGYADGSFSGRDFYDGRTVTIELLIVGDSSHNAQYYYRQLQANLAPQVTGYYPDPYASTQATGVLGLFQFQLTSTTGIQRMWGRVRSISAPVDVDFSYGYIAVTAEFYFPDPRYYDDSANTSSTGSVVSVWNNGWATTSPAITIASPLANGAITDSYGNIMTFANVNTSYPLVIDLLQRTVTQNGAPARNTLTTMTKWLDIPGNVPSSSPTSWTSTLNNMTVTWRNAYV